MGSGPKKQLLRTASQTNMRADAVLSLLKRASSRPPK